MQRVKISYPRLRPESAVVELDLEDVRAARSIRVTYDFARDGWSISAPNNPGDGEMSDLDDVWGEVAFVDAWHEPPEAEPPIADGEYAPSIHGPSDEDFAAAEAARARDAVPTPTLVDDFRKLYGAALVFAEVCAGKRDGKPYEPHKALMAELERLTPLMEALR